jgi:hypothetical protein
MSSYYRVTVETGIKSTTIGVQPEVSEFQYTIYAKDLDEAMSLAYKAIERLRKKEKDHFYTLKEVVSET